MTLNQRRILYSVFIALFVVVGAVLLFHIQGFRYDFQTGTVERTGAIDIVSVPTGATVRLNGKAVTKATPVTIQSLVPADYEVTITSVGTQPWQKILPVKPSLVTFTGQVRLWPQPQQGTARSVNQPVDISNLSPNRQGLLFYSSHGLTAGLWLLNLTSGQTTLLSRPSGSQPEALEWSPSGNELLVTDHTTSGYSWRTFNLSYQTWNDVSAPEDVLPTLIHWGQTDDELLMSNGQELYEFNRPANTAQLLWTAALQDFRTSDGVIFGLTKEPGQTPTLKILNPSSLQPIPLGQNLILSATVNFLPGQPKWLPLLDQDRHTLYLLHNPLTSQNPVRQLPEVTAIDWSADGQTLLLNNHFEIWQYSVEDDKLNLFQRLSTPITTARMFNDEGYLVYAQDKQLWALEFDTRGEQQKWLLATYPTAIRNIFIDPKGDSLTVELPNGYARVDLTTESSL